MNYFKSKLLVASLALLPATQAFSQVDISLNPLGLLFGSYGVSVEKVLDNNIGVSAGMSYLNREVFEIDYTGFSADALFKYYFNPRVREGADQWYAGVFLQYADLNSNHDSDELKVSALSLGGAGGYKTVSRKGIFFEIALGIGRNLTSTYELNGVNDEEFDDFAEYVPAFYGKLALGYRIK